uniref:Uncharacterized protein n=2 Tax=Chlamydomonas euryale TaxID=1486919 RepID=A0A6U2HKF5_9CHLO|mmetsp:Transcript_38832/g.115459  ORF Transcript_38832/g.115459 Transcript_38832/m.115459 type:complete len:215 (+) Transcript_38832:1097-1741(+)
MALFFNKEHEANELFNTIVSTYTRLSEVASAAAASAPAAKTVAWIQWWPARPSWGLPNVSTIEIQWPTYKRALVEAAGAELLDNTKLQAYLDDGRLTDHFSWRPVDNGGAFLPASDGDLLREILADVDVVIDTARYNDDDQDFSDGDVSDVDIDLDAFLQRHSLNASDIATLPFLRNNGLLRSDGLTNSGSWTEWFGIMVVRPDQVGAPSLTGR